MPRNLPAMIRAPVRTSLAVALVCVTGACGARGGVAAPEPVELSGQITYRDRFALPEGAVALVELVELSDADAAGRTVASQRIAPAGPVPIRFTLRYERDEIAADAHYEIRGRIEDGDGLVLYTTPAVLIGDPRRGARVEILLRRIAHGAAQDGGADGDAAVEPWKRAVAAGIEVRAVGRRPAWTLELADHEPIVLVTDDGLRREAFLHVQRTTPSATETRYRARHGERRVEVLLRALPCVDEWTGEPFDLTVTVTVDQAAPLRGCGRRLRPAK